MTGARRAGRRPRHSSLALVDRRARRSSPAWAFTLYDSSGHPWRLTARQAHALVVLRALARNGRYTVTVTALADVMGCGRGEASKVVRRLRSLSLVGGHHPARGRHGGLRFYIPRAAAAQADALARRTRWPSWRNDSTLTGYAGYLSRAGIGRSWRRSVGSPPAARPPGGGPARAPASPRARGRPWPPAYVDEPCPRKGRVGRLPLRWSTRSGPDLGAVYGGPCPRCRRAHVATVALVAPDPEPARRPGDRFPTPGQRRLAAELLEVVGRQEVADTLRLRYLGWVRVPVYEPPVRPAIDGPAAELERFVAEARAGVLVDLADVARTRQLVPPAS